jgi:hypothetical protein
MKAVLNIERIGFNALKAHAQHERREIGDQTHTDESRTHLNASIGLDKCPEAAVRKYLEQTGAKIDKRNEKPFTRVLLSASPEYFRPGRADQSGEFDRDRLNPWIRESVKWLKKEFGDDAVHISTHLDETTPHLHAVIVPTYDKKTKRRTVKQVSHHKHPAFASLNSYEDLHDKYAAAVQHLDIQRGDRLPDELRKERRSTTKKEWLNGRIKAASAQLSLLDGEIRKHLGERLRSLRKTFLPRKQQQKAGSVASAALAQVRSKTRTRGRSR